MLKERTDLAKRDLALTDLAGRARDGRGTGLAGRPSKRREKNRSIGRILATCGLTAVFNVSPGLPDVSAQATEHEGRLGITVESREAAALVVAFEHYRTLLKKEGIDLTASEFIKLHRAIRLRTEEGQIHIYFHPPNRQTAGGAVEYVIDADRLQVTERIGER